MLKNIQLELEELFDIFNKELFNNQLEPCFITIQVAKQNIKGWEADNCWIDLNEKKYHEININPIYFTGTLEASETLIHEMVHLYNVQFGKKDCSKTGYHNKVFKTKAEEVGLTVEYSKKGGWNLTGLSPKLELFIFDLKRPNVFIYKRGLKTKAPNKSKAKTYKYRCSNCYYEVTSKIKDLKLQCGVCGEFYKQANIDNNDVDDSDND